MCGSGDVTEIDIGLPTYGQVEDHVIIGEIEQARQLLYGHFEKLGDWVRNSWPATLSTSINAKAVRLEHEAHHLQSQELYLESSAKFTEAAQLRRNLREVLMH